MFASLPDARVEKDLGEQLREGRRVHGFQTTLPTLLNSRGVPPERGVVWVDVETQTLTALTTTEESDDRVPRIDAEMTDVHWNEKLDDSLFEVPSDYRLYKEPDSLRDGETLETRHLQPGVKLTLIGTATGEKEYLTEAAVDWVALRNSGDDLTLIVRLNPEATDRVRESAPWQVNLNDVVQTRDRTMDFKHGLLLIDVSSVAQQVSQWLTPVQSTYVVTTGPKH